MTRNNGKKYECVEFQTCAECAFNGKKSCDIAKCTPEQRSDKNMVSFIRRKDLENK